MNKMASKLFFCTLALLGLSAVFGQVIEEAIQKVTRRTNELKPLVEGADNGAIYRGYLDDIDTVLMSVDRETSKM